MGKIKEYIKEFKKESKKDIDIYDVDDDDFYRQVEKDLKEEWAEEKKEMTTLGSAMLFMLFIILLIGGIIYFSFHKQFEKMINNYIDNIPIYNSDNQNETGDNGQSENNSNTGGDSQGGAGNVPNECSKPFDGIYKLGIEEVTFQSDSYFDKSVSNITTATGLYKIYNSTIVVDVTFEDYTINQSTLTFTITSDCKKITEVGTGKVFIRQK